MNTEDSLSAREAQIASPESITALLASKSEEVLEALLENAALDEGHVCLMLERKDLPSTLLDKIAKRKAWSSSYRVRKALATHPHTPRLVAIRLLRDLHLMDLVRISLQPAASGELRRLAEERVLSQIPQLPLGQRLSLARRGSARVLGGLVAEGPEQVARVALDNSLFSESQLLKSLAKECLSTSVLSAIATHGKWSKLVNVRVALLMHPNAPAESVIRFVPDLSAADLEGLLGLAGLPAAVRGILRSELARREKS